MRHGMRPTRNARCRFCNAMRAIIEESAGILVLRPFRRKTHSTCYLVRHRKTRRLLAPYSSEKETTRTYERARNDRIPTRHLSRLPQGHSACASRRRGEKDVYAAHGRRNVHLHGQLQRRAPQRPGLLPARRVAHPHRLLHRVSGEDTARRQVHRHAHRQVRHPEPHRLQEGPGHHAVQRVRDGAHHELDCDAAAPRHRRLLRAPRARSPSRSLPRSSSTPSSSAPSRRCCTTTTLP